MGDGESVFNGHRTSVWKDVKTLKMDMDSGEGTQY